MAANVTLVTTDGRIIQGINYSVNPTAQTATVDALTAQMAGGAAMGVYRIKTPMGWEYVPASQIAAVTRFQAGRPT